MNFVNMEMLELAEFFRQKMSDDGIVLVHAEALQFEDEAIDDSKFDESELADDEGEPRIENSLESLKAVDRYLNYLHENLPDELPDEWVDAIFWAGAYVGDVLMNASERDFNWLSYDDAVTLSDEHLAELGEKELTVAAVLITDNGEMLLPIRQVVKALYEGPEFSVHDFASRAAEVAVSDAPALPELIAAWKMEEEFYSELARHLEIGDAEFEDVDLDDIDLDDDDDDEFDDEMPVEIEDQVTYGFRQLRRGELNDAADTFRLVLEQDSKNVRAHIGLGDCAIYLLDLDEAAACFQRAVDVDANSADAYFSRGSLYTLTEQYELAIADLSHAIFIDGGHEDARTCRASVYLSEGRVEDALADYTAIIEHCASDPDRYEDEVVSEAYFARARAHDSQNNFTAAVADFLKAKETGYPGAELPLAVAHAYQSMADFALAIQWFEKAQAMNPSDGDVVNGLGWLLATVPEASLQDGPRAVQLAQQALELVDLSEMHIVFDTLAAAYARVGDFAAAVSNQQSALEKADESSIPSYKSRLELYQQEKTHDNPL